MVRGYYTAASGIVVNEKRLNTHAQNVANNLTAGYKKDNLIQGTFGEHIAVRMNTYNPSPLHQLGRGVFMTTIDVEYVDHEQGALDYTQRTLDFAIMGEGYFRIRDAEGNMHLTRDGQFALDPEGYLILPGVGRVQGENGDIQLNLRSDFVVDREGVIYLEPETADDELEEVDRFSIVMPTDLASVKKSSIGTFIADAFTVVEPNSGTELMQFHTEKSNVNMTEEMTRIIASQRGLQSASQLVKMYDEMTQKSIDQIGRLR